MDPSSIGKAGNKLNETSASKVSKDSAAPSEQGASTVAKGDTVQLTSNAKLLERLDKSLASLPDINEARVAEIKTAIENGDYEIDADAIAAAMLRFERSLGD
ncbi:MAG: flagellar biosynthesis anti-sigma factor FlgM [Woeseiaceae bacterium]|nr:flagellar biosynthesis anti-sigma factor FlgM [Woeseiaceae bacterium]